MVEDYVIPAFAGSLLHCKFHGLNCFSKYLQDNKNLSGADIARLGKIYTDLLSHQLEQQATELSKKHFKEGLELIVREPEKALELMEESFRLNPQNAHALLYKGLILRNLGKYQLAIQAYKKAGEIRSENVDQYIIDCLERQIKDEVNNIEKFHLYSKLIKLNKKHKEAITFMTQFLVIKFSEEQNSIYENLDQDIEIPFHNIHLDDGSDMEIAESEENKIEIFTKQEPKESSQAALYFYNKAIKDTLPPEPELEILPTKWIPVIELEEEDTASHGGISRKIKVERPRGIESDKRRESSGKYRSVSPLSDSSSKSTRKKDHKLKYSSSTLHRYDRREHPRRRRHRSPSVSPRCLHSYTKSPRLLSRGNGSSKARSHKNSPF